MSSSPYGEMYQGPYYISGIIRYLKVPVPRVHTTGMKNRNGTGNEAGYLQMQDSGPFGERESGQVSFTAPERWEAAARNEGASILSPLFFGAGIIPDPELFSCQKKDRRYHEPG